jgi:hypothetical protein
VKNPHHAFLRRGSKAVCPMSQLCGMLKNQAVTWKSDCLAKFGRPFLAHTSSLRSEVSRAVWHGAPLMMNGGTKDEGLEYKRPRRLKCDRRNFRQPHPWKKKNSTTTFTNLKSHNHILQFWDEGQKAQLGVG